MLIVPISCKASKDDGHSDIIGQVKRDPRAQEYLKQYLPKHRQEVAIGDRAVALAQLVKTRRMTSGPVRVAIDRTLLVLWQSSCAPYTESGTVPPEILGHRIEILDTLPSDLTMLNCDIAFRSGYGQVPLIWRDGAWKPE